MPTILHWIRAVANAPLSAGCKGFCLELIPQMNSSSLSSSFSTGRMASKVSAAPNSVKVYRAQLQKAGLLKMGQGWHLAIPGEEEEKPKGVYTDIPENSSSDTHIYQRGISPYTKGGYVKPTAQMLASALMTPLLRLGTGSSNGRTPRVGAFPGAIGRVLYCPI